MQRDAADVSSTPAGTGRPAICAATAAWLNRHPLPWLLSALQPLPQAPPPPAAAAAANTDAVSRTVAAGWTCQRTAASCGVTNRSSNEAADGPDGAVSNHEGRRGMSASGCCSQPAAVNGRGDPRMSCPDLQIMQTHAGKKTIADHRAAATGWRSECSAPEARPHRRDRHGIGVRRDLASLHPATARRGASPPRAHSRASASDACRIGASGARRSGSRHRRSRRWHHASGRAAAELVLSDLVHGCKAHVRIRCGRLGRVDPGWRGASAYRSGRLRT